jgi:aldose 1-epimerase
MDERTLRSKELEVAMLPQAGGRLHRLAAFGHSVLRTPADPGTHLSAPFFWGAYVMAPWCNRLEATPVRFGSRGVDLPSNFPDGSAIHGQVYARSWDTQSDGRLTVRGGGDGWPWMYEVGQRLTVAGPELRIELELTNLDDEPMPAGLGIHPWFSTPLQAAIHGTRVLPDNLDGAGRLRAADGRFDRRALRALPEGLDATWTDLSDPAVELVWPGRAQAFMRVETAGAFIAGASPAGMDAIAIEPETHAPQGLRRLLAGAPGGLAMLEPHRTLSLTVRLAFAPLPP